MPRLLRASPPSLTEVAPEPDLPLTLLGRAADEQLMPESESSSQKKESPQRLRRCLIGSPSCTVLLTIG